MGDLEAIEEAFLLDAVVPYLCPVGQGGDDEGVVDLSPVHEVQASDRVSQDADASDGGAILHQSTRTLPT